MDISLDIVFFSTFGVIGFVSTILHRMHAVQNLHHKGDVTANYWGTYAKAEEEPKKAEGKKSNYPKMTNKGTLTLPAASSQNMTCIAGKVTSRGK